MSEKPTLRIRFTLNQQTGASTSNRRALQRAGKQFSGMIIEEVGLRVVEEKYRQLTGQIRKEITRDIQQEIENVARLYSQMVVGRTGVRNKFFNIKAQTTHTSSRQGSSFGYWKPLAESTVARKGHSRFFEGKGSAHRKSNRPGPQGDLSFAMRRSSFWEKSFGPVSVRISRTSNPSKQPTEIYKDQGSRGSHFSVAKIHVVAMGKITSAMLPELLTNNPARSNYSGGRSSGLVDLIADRNTKLKIGNWGREGQGAYRPSLEPFLGFVLTRAIPAAVTARITKRLDADRPTARRAVR